MQTIIQILLNDLMNYTGKIFEGQETNGKVWVREKGNPRMFQWDKKTNTIFSHLEGDTPVFDNCHSYNDMFKFVVKQMQK